MNVVNEKQQMEILNKWIAEQKKEEWMWWMKSK